MAEPAGDRRRSEVDRLLEVLALWAANRDDIRALALVGSWARHEALSDSDVDLVLLTTEPKEYIEARGWWTFAPSAELVETRRWGLLCERRLELGSGLEVDVGIAPLIWARVDPPDPGSIHVLRSGCKVLHDPDGLFGRLLAADPGD